MEYYKINTKFTEQKRFNNGSLANTYQLAKTLSIPINLSFSDNGYSDLINEIAQEEKDTNINSVIDRETIKFNSTVYNTSTKSNLVVNFNFLDDNNTSGNGFIDAGFEQNDISNSRNNFVKSFFKLDFYDSDNEKTQNFLFSEFFNIDPFTTEPKFPFNRLFWLKRDTNFIESIHRDLYFNVNFFNAKDGKIIQFINRNVVGPITITEYKNNPEWRFSKLKVLNPMTDITDTESNPNRVFYVEPINGNTDDLITFTEVKII